MSEQQKQKKTQTQQDYPARALPAEWEVVKRAMVETRCSPHTKVLSY